MITESLTTTGHHVLCRFCGRPIRFFPVTVTTLDATTRHPEVSFLVPDIHEDCRVKEAAATIFQDMKR